MKSSTSFTASPFHVDDSLLFSRRPRLKHFIVLFLVVSVLAVIPKAIMASDSENVTHIMTSLVFEIGFVIFAAKLGGMLFEKINMPSVLGELVIGILIGPYMLGVIPFPGFEHGLFPLPASGTLPVSTELYGIATIASIILLFSAGLETDFTLFLQFSLAGTILGIGGVVFSFLFGALTAVFMLQIPFMDPRALFLGIMSTATSVGITARILSECRKMDSPEGVSIMAGAVIDDILGIILLAIVLGITTSDNASGAIQWGSIGLIALKAIGVWLAFTVIGLIFARHISKFLKFFKNVAIFSVLALGLAFILAGIFEKAGLAMIVGAYVMGLALSRTDLSYVIHERLHTIQLLFVPVFFTVMGMLVNPAKLMSKEVLIFGLVYTLGAIIAKILGCGLPSLLMRFNLLGALRIGLGMVPRGEVALIIAGIGLSNGFLDDTVFGVAIMMTLFTTVVAPPLLKSSLNVEKRGTKKELGGKEKAVVTMDIASPGLAKIIADRIIESFHNEGFFINVTELAKRTYHIKKEEIDILFSVGADGIEFVTDEEDIPFVKNVLYESLLAFASDIGDVSAVVDSIDRKQIVAKGRSNKLQVRKFLKMKNIFPELNGKTKDEILHELVHNLFLNGEIADFDDILNSIKAREAVMSTGLTDGIAIPHAKTNSVKQLVVAMGISREGVDFESLDGKKSKIFFMLLSPDNVSSSHLQMLSNITSIFCDEQNRETLIECKTQPELYEFFSK